MAMFYNIITNFYKENIMTKTNYKILRVQIIGANNTSIYLDENKNISEIQVSVTKFPEAIDSAFTIPYALLDSFTTDSQLCLGVVLGNEIVVSKRKGQNKVVVQFQSNELRILQAVGV